MSACKVCGKLDCLGPGTVDNRSGKRCCGTIDTECAPPASNHQLDEIAEYLLDNIYHSKAPLRLNSRIILSLIKEIKELRHGK
jgi:hypothetical protein